MKNEYKARNQRKIHGSIYGFLYASRFGSLIRQAFDIRSLRTCISRAMIAYAALPSIAFIVILLPLALADVQFTSPDGGATVAGGKAISITWKESGEKPPIADLVSYSLYLWAGGNEADQQVSSHLPHQMKAMLLDLIAADVTSLVSNKLPFLRVTRNSVPG